MRLDWYQATVPEDGQVVLEKLLSRFDLVDAEQDRPRNSFTEAVAIKRGDQRVASLMWGGVNPGAHLCFTGGEAPAGREFIKEHWPSHRVSRVDACEDYCEDGAWDVLEALCKSVADRHRVKLYHAGDFHRAQSGRTLYLGGKESPVRVRCYEKGHEMRAKGAEQADLRWVRAECQVRPPSRVKSLVAQLTEREVWGCARFSGDFMNLLDSAEVKATPMNEFRPSDDERAYRAMLKQYGPLLGRLAALQGWEMLGRTIGEDLEARKGG